MKMSLVFALSLSVLFTGCGKQADPQPVTPTVATGPNTQPALVGTWLLMDQVFSVQATAASPQAFGGMYPHNGTSVFLFRADGTAVYSPKLVANQPDPGRAGAGKYAVTGALLTWDAAPPQSFTIVSLSADRLVLDRRTSEANGTITTERRGFRRQ